MVKIHPTAIVSPKAEIADDVEVGPYAIIGDNVIIDSGTTIGPGTWIKNHVVIGKNNRIGSHVLIGGEPQDVNWKEKIARVEIGDENIIREYVSIHASTSPERTTRIGNNNFLMAYVHVAHDCKIGNGVIIVNYTGLSGFVEVDDHAFISGLSGFHQFVRVGKLAMIGGLSKITQDVPPYFTVTGNPAVARGINVIGMRRKGIPPRDRSAVRKMYRMMLKEKNMKFAIENIQSDPELRDNPLVKEVIEFIASSRRGITKLGEEGKGLAL